MLCSASNCGKPAISIGLCIEHFQRPVRKHGMTAMRKATLLALAEKYVAANDPPRGVWPGLHYSMGRNYRKGGIYEYLEHWLLANGRLPDGTHDVFWNKGQNCMQIDFTRLRNDPAYPVSIWNPDYGKT
jgi:hypothetical protein